MSNDRILGSWRTDYMFSELGPIMIIVFLGQIVLGYYGCSS